LKEPIAKENDAMLTLSVVASTVINHNTKIITLSQTGNDPKLKLSLGQHVRVIMDGGSRPYTPVSVDTPGEVRLLVKKYDKGVFSTYLHGLDVGREVKITGPHGTYFYRPDHYKSLLLLAMGTGITPIWPILKKQTSSMYCDTLLLFGNKKKEDIYYLEELENLVENNHTFRVMHFLSEEDSKEYGMNHGRITKECIQEHISSDFAQTRSCILICGSQAFKAEMLKIVEELKLNADKIHLF